MAELDTNVSTETSQEVDVETTETAEAKESAELTRLKAEMAKQKAALDKATKEAAEAKRSLRAKQSAEEVAQEEAKAQHEALMQELETLRKEKSVAAMTAKIVPFVGDNDVSAQIAEYLYGAEDADAALTAIQKAWTAKEKALRAEFGKIPPPGVGSGDGATITKKELDEMTYLQRVKFANDHPTEYERLMGRAT